MSSATLSATTVSGLHDWFVSLNGNFSRPPGSAGKLVDELNATGVLESGLPNLSIIAPGYAGSSATRS
jgi:hypothetical protein